jgi:hypothetical protein
MAKKLPLTDFRAVRGKLEPHEFANPEGQDVSPSDLVDPDVWNGIMHLPEDVSIRVSDHQGLRLRLMHQLWGDWIEAIGNPDKPDEMFNCLSEAADCLQGATFNFLHGFYRIALAELRTTLELAMIGTYGNLYPTDSGYLEWKAGEAEMFGFTRCRKRLLGSLKKGQAKWLFEDDAPLAVTYQKLCCYTHARPDAGYGMLWESNGPVYNNKALRLTFFTSLSVHALCYLLIRLGRPSFDMPEGSEILFELDWMPDHAGLVRAYTDLFGKPPALDQRYAQSAAEAEQAVEC